jgi:hypothetical protein
MNPNISPIAETDADAILGTAGEECDIPFGEDDSQAVIVMTRAPGNTLRVNVHGEGELSVMAKHLVSIFASILERGAAR